MLKKFDSFCVDNNIKYSLIGGSLIGAIRNKGIIPWDDDIDIILMPDEYEKLLLALKKTKFNYRFIGYSNMDDYSVPGYKFVNDETYIVENNIKKEYGIFIDVFKYNYIPDGFLKKMLYLWNYKRMLFVIHGFGASKSKEPNFIKKIREYIHNIFKNINR